MTPPISSSRRLPVAWLSALVRLWNRTGFALICLGLLLPFAHVADAAAAYGDWPHTGSIYLLTTPEGADLPATALVQGFPVLVRLHRDFFRFEEAKASGDDLRFSNRAGEPLPYQIETWDAVKGEAVVWVRIPAIRGNERQELRLHWGKAEATTESNGAAVFNASNGFLSVWHLGEPVKDEVGPGPSQDEGTTQTPGRIGPARHLAGGQGIFGGDKLANYPVGASPHSSELWFRAERGNGRLLGWGNEQAQGKVVMQFRSPPHVRVDCYFSGADVASSGRLPLNEWVHVMHTYQPGDSRLYVNGVLRGVSTRTGSPLAIRSPARLFIGGWYHDYDFVGDIDEVRVSNVARSPDWVKLQYENQKARQTLSGPVVSSGKSFAVLPTRASVSEGKHVTFTAQAAGALKLYWLRVVDGKEAVAEVDRLGFTFDAGRVTGDQPVTLRFKAVYPDEVRTQDLVIDLKDDLANPEFTLAAPATWDGRSLIEVVPQVANRAALNAQGVGELRTEWNVSPFAVIREVAPGKLLLKRAMNSGPLTVTATISNGGAPVARSVTLDVTEPKADAWVTRRPAADEKPEDGQFYARDDRNEGTLHYRGSLAETADAVFLRLYADDRLVRTDTASVVDADRSYVFALKLQPGLIKYRVEFGTRMGAIETVRHTATNLVCGDAFLIDGQSNALATDTGETSPPETHDWIRSYGQPVEKAGDPPGNLWCNPVWKAQKGEKAELGWWGMELAKRLVASQKIPIFILNAAVGGTRIDQHQRNPTDSLDLSTLYGRMLWRLRQAKLTHGIRGILWHQGENDQGADGPTGGYGWETYRRLFMDLAGAWQEDLPNVQHFYVFQIWPDSCSMGGREGSGDMLREQQRTLPKLVSRLSVLSTLGVRPPGGCHFPLAGWAEFARLIQPVMERDHYGVIPNAPVTPPNLRQVAYAGEAKDTLALEFDQPVVWSDNLVGQFYLDGAKGQVVTGSVVGNVLNLQLANPSAAQRITYLKETSWSQDRLLLGANGLAALTFCEVPISSRP